MRRKRVALLVVGRREHARRRVRATRRAQAVAAACRRRPSTPGRRGRSGTACPAPASSVRSSAKTSTIEHDDVDVVEEVQVDVRDVERQRRVARRPETSRARARRRCGGTRASASRRAARAAAPLAFAVEEALHVGQEGHELVVVALPGSRAGSQLNSSRSSRHGCVGARLRSSSQCSWICAPSRIGISCSGQSRICRNCRTSFLASHRSRTWRLAGWGRDRVRSQRHELQ